MAKVLIVDDEEGIRILYSMELQDEGYEVVTLPDGKDLIETVGKEKPDCVVLDIKMRETSGLDLLQEIRKKHYDLPVILNSAYSSYKVDLKAVAADYLHPEGLVMLFVGDAEKFEQPLSNFGDVNTIELPE